MTLGPTDPDRRTPDQIRREEPDYLHDDHDLPSGVACIVFIGIAVIVGLAFFAGRMMG